MNQAVKRPGKYVIGVDEMGTGAWAGPFFVCAAAVPVGWKPPTLLTDSKNLKTDASRERAFAQLISDPHVLFHFRAVTHTDIDAHGQGPTLRWAMRTAAVMLMERVDFEDLIFDGSHCHHPAGRAETKADGKYPAVMAASVLGKVARDRRMIFHYGAKYPQWLFATHKGYGSPAHESAIERHGLSPIHRRSIGRFAGM